MKEFSEPLTDIDTLSKACEQIEGAPYLALDTEFTRYRTYRPQLELLQIASDESIFCVDATQISDWTLLRNIIHSPKTTVVLHAADQDLELLQLHDLLPSQIIDSKIAAALCGETKLSYQHQVEQRLQVSLPKELTRSKWNRRPFSSDQIRYALNDVRFVLPLFRSIRSILEQHNRVSWLQEDCQRLLELPRGDDIVAQTWKSFHCGAILSIPNQYIARKLVIWREKRANAINWPRQWVLSDGTIISMVQSKPKSVQQTAQRMGLKSSRIPSWVSLVHSILHKRPDESETPLWNSWQSLVATDKRRVDKLLKIVSQVADEHGIESSILCTKQEAVDIYCGKQSARILTGWRRAITDSVINFSQITSD